MKSELRTPRTEGSTVSESTSAIGRLIEEKRGRTSSSGGDRGDEGSWDADHLRLQFVIIDQKHYIKTISRTEGARVGENYQIVEENRITQK
jgi:hypothetical protein